MFELLILAIAPAIFLAWYFYMRDRYEQEPKMLLLLTYILGMLSVIPAFLIETIGSIILPVSDVLTLALYAFVIVALTEEFVKLSVVTTFAYRSKEFNETMDGIVYCVVASLGFATVENIHYALQFGLVTTLMRGILSVPGHALWGGLMGYFVGRAKMDKKNEKIRIIQGLSLAVILHGLYDFIIFYLDPMIGLIMLFALMILSGVTMFLLLKKAENLSPFKKWGPPIPRLVRFCPRCGDTLVYIQQYNRWYCYTCKEYL